MEWYAAAPKSDRRAPAGEEADKEAPEEREGGGGAEAAELVAAMPKMDRWPEKTDRSTGRAGAAFNRGASEPDRGEPSRAGTRKHMKLHGIS